MKRLLTFITSVFIFVSVLIPACAANNLPYVNDNADLLTDEETYRLESLLKQKSEELEFDIVVLTVDSVGGKTVEAYADDYYDYTGYGYGDDFDGCLLLVSMGEREWHISTTGFGITALTDAGIDYIGEQFQSYLSTGDYYNAFSIYSETVAEFVQQADAGTPYDYYNLNEYDSSYGTYNEDSENSLGSAIIFGIIFGGIFTLIFIGVLKGNMKTVHHKTQANDYLVNDSLTIIAAHDTFIGSNIVKTAKESKSSSGGGSSTHSGSSGRSHGGGGGHF